MDVESKLVRMQLLIKKMQSMTPTELLCKAFENCSGLPHPPHRITYDECDIEFRENGDAKLTFTEVEYSDPEIGLEELGTLKIEVRQDPNEIVGLW